MAKLLKRRDFLKSVGIGTIGIGFSGLAFREAFGQEKAVFIKIASGAPGTTYYAFSAPMGNLVDEYSKNPKIATTVSTSGGGLGNVRLLDAGETDIACTIANTAWAAYNGVEPFKTKVDIRAILMAEALPYYFVVRDSSKSKTVSDVLNAKLTVGDQAGGTHLLFKDIMKVLGYSYKESNVAYMPYGECKDALADNKVEAWWAFQSGNIDALVATTKVRFITFSDAELQKILKEKPMFTQVPVPENAYGKGTPGAAFLSIGAPSLWVCKPDMNPDLVYQLVKIICEHKDVVQKSQPSSKMFDAKFAAASKAIPYHDGAIKYYKEVGAM